MAKARHQFLCNNCGSVHPKWFGKCPDCGTWDSLQEYKEPTADARKESRSRGATGDLVQGAVPQVIGDIDESHTPRQATGIGEFDRILGGGVVPGSAVLVGGEPGIGKSTLLLQVASALAAGEQGLGSGVSGLGKKKSADSALHPRPQTLDPRPDESCLKQPSNPTRSSPC